MKNLTFPDRHRLNAAEGWLDLGDHEEAEAELRQLSPGARETNDYFNLHWRLLVLRRQWSLALQTAQTQIEVAPDHPSGWINLSYCLHELDRTTEARETLKKVVRKFNDLPVVPYNLACYECQLGDIEASKRWLLRAIRVGKRQEIIHMAQQDDDLRPLWPSLESLA